MPAIRAALLAGGAVVGLGLPLGWLASEVRRGKPTRESQDQQGDAPSFATELADAPRQPGAWL